MAAGRRAVDAVAANAVLIAVRQAANLLCDRWSLKILLALTLGARRYGEIRERCGIANRLITGRLRMQEESGMVVRMPYTRRPLRHEYQLTNRGLDLFGVFATMLAWEQRRAIAAAAPRLQGQSKRS